MYFLLECNINKFLVKHKSYLGKVLAVPSKPLLKHIVDKNR